MAKGHPVHSVTVVRDDGQEAYALVTAKGDGQYNLLVCNPGDSTWSVMNDVPEDRVK